MNQNYQPVRKLLVFLLMSVSMFQCMEEEPEEEVVVNEYSIAPSSTQGRSNNYLGCVEINSRTATIQAWDHGTVDGDIISLIANGTTVLDEHTLSGPTNKVSRNYQFNYNGYNYLVLYAHNEGSISPNTASISINGEEFVLESSLSTNGYVDIIVTGYGVECGSSGGSGSGDGSGSGGTGSTTGYNATFWLRSDLGCGNISVNLQGYGTKTITGYYSSGLSSCGGSSAANFTGIPAGTYSFTASCTDKSWSGTVTLGSNSCFLMELTD